MIWKIKPEHSKDKSRAGVWGASSTKIYLLHCNEENHNDKIMAEGGGRQHGLDRDGEQEGHMCE